MSVPRLDRLDDPAPHVRLLSNGRWTTLVTGAGTGCSACAGQALTAWRADPTEDGDGLFVYVRDLDRGTVWSAGHAPVLRAAARYAAGYRPGVLSIAREDEEIETRLEVAVVPDEDAEIRRLRLENRSRRPRRLEVTSYAEAVLSAPAAHAAHPAFAKLFVETEWVPASGVVLARRRPRRADEPVPWLVHGLAGEGPLEHETDRARFLGRGGGPARPRALRERGPLSGTTGAVLDPVVSLRRTVTLAPAAAASLTLLLGLAPSREAALTLAGRHARPEDADEVLALAARRERALLARLGLSEEDAECLQDLAGALLYGHPALRAGGPGDAAAPRLVVDADGPGGRALAAEVLAARDYWRASGVGVDVLIVAADPAGLEGAVERAGAPSDPPTSFGTARGEVRVVGREALTPRERLGSACVVARPLAEVVAGLASPAGRASAARVFRPAGEVEAPSGGAAPRGGVGLRFDNGHGGFAPDGREYVIRLDPDGPSGPRRPPMPWANVVATEGFGFLVSESGAGYTWSRNSREHRLTPWSNDPVADPHGEALWVRDEDAGVFWSPLPGPTPGPWPYEAVHGFGWSRWRSAGRDLEQEVCLFVSREDPVKVVRLRLTNTSARRRRLSVFSYARLVLGADPRESGRSVVTALDAASGAVLARNPASVDFADAIVFAAAVAPAGAAPARVSGDRTAFLGRHGTPAEPAAVRDGGGLDGRTGAGLDPCAALEVALTVEAGETVECGFLLGEAPDPEVVRAVVGRLRAPGALDRALDEVAAFWRETLTAVQVETPSPAIDLMVNGWLVYQNLACRLWGRSALYQSGGAFGFRDQLQDAAALLWVAPAVTRAQILLHAAHQFPEGDVLHWWHPPVGRGTRTRFSDDLLWLPLVTAQYVQATGDWGVLDESVGFVTARALAPDEDEAYLLPTVAAERADLYTHCCRALDRALTAGPHGLPLMGTGDWNDGMNRVGREGRGESVWLGFFLAHVLEGFLAVSERRGDAGRVRRYRAYREELCGALERAGWDGAWYRRAYYDDGTPLGTAAGDECRIDALVQAWAVISGAAPRERAERAMDAVCRELVSERDGIVRLLWPPFDRTTHDPGYIRGYVPGIRENGGQYTHAALWVVRALAELGRRDRAAALLEMLGPVAHARDPAGVTRYQVEPYVVAADVYGVAPHVGRGGWTWYTGSAGWMLRVAVESVLGLGMEDGHTLRVAPCIPDAWPGFGVRLRLPDGRTRYEVTVANPAGSARRVARAEVDGAPAAVADGAARVPLRRDGAVHRVTVTLGG